MRQERNAELEGMRQLGDDPPTPCRYCDENHWQADCPEKAAHITVQQRAIARRQKTAKPPTTTNPGNKNGNLAMRFPDFRRLCPDLPENPTALDLFRKQIALFQSGTAGALPPQFRQQWNDLVDKTSNELGPGQTALRGRVAKLYI